ncbi:hypothetical protein [Lysobacter gummosus]|uniref:hypothetical protein n=1 Tax=Lysobacter gummosus TaxID=262324 RepID=UPI00362E6980
MRFSRNGLVSRAVAARAGRGCVTLGVMSRGHGIRWGLGLGAGWGQVGRCGLARRRRDRVD